jgi:ketosteroid isomerase-like protein
MASAYAFPSASQDEAAAIERAVEGYYAAYRGLDKAKYRACLTDDYVLLEDGELLDAAGDLAVMAAPGSGYQRADAFDFKLVKTQGDVGYAVYLLSSDIKDQKGPRHREWLESMILRRSSTGWRTALLHSTRLTRADGSGRLAEPGHETENRSQARLDPVVGRMKMKTIAGAFIMCAALNVVLADVPVLRTPLTAEDVRGVKKAIAAAKLTCELDSTDAFGRGDTAMYARILCKSSTDEAHRVTISEVYCDGEQSRWTCRLRGTRVRFGDGAHAADFVLDPGISVSDGVRVYDTCLQQAKFYVNSVKRSEQGFVASGQDTILAEADVVLGDDPACTRRTAATPAIRNEPPSLPSPETSVKPPPNPSVKPPQE